MTPKNEPVFFDTGTLRFWARTPSSRRDVPQGLVRLHAPIFTNRNVLHHRYSVYGRRGDHVDPQRLRHELVILCEERSRLRNLLRQVGQAIPFAGYPTS